MKTEKNKMLAGELYDPRDKQIANDRLHARLLLKELNDSRPDDPEARGRILKALLPNAAADLWLEPPFYCDYGYNIKTGEKVFLNFDCVMLDVMEVIIGSRTLLGPAVQLYTAMHPMSGRERATGVEYAKPLVIGEDVWIGGGAIICPGVTIGNGAVIGAGSVVTKDIPPGVFAAGNPCKVVRSID